MDFFINDKKVRYNPYNMKKDKSIGDGLEANAYKIGNKAVKFFKRYPGKKIYLTKESIEKMKHIRTKRILLPTDALLDKHHNIRGYQMDYIENLGENSYFNLDKSKLKEEYRLLRGDIEVLSDNKILIEDLNHQNTIYHNGLYLVDPGSYEFNYNFDENRTYGINILRINEYLIFNIIKNYGLKLQRNDASINVSVMCYEINEEYNKSGKKDAIEFFSDIKEDNLEEFIQSRISSKK